MFEDRLYKQFQMGFEKFYSPLCTYANSFVREQSICEDIVQEVFVRIWEIRKDLIQSDNLRFYLFTAVRNNCLTHLKKEQRTAIYSLSDMNLENDDAMADITPPADEIHNYQELLRIGIDQLPPKCKEVFLLARMGELSNQQVADSLGISVKTVNNQLWKALKLLRAFVRNIAVCFLFFL